MKIYREDVKDIIMWIAFIAFLFGAAYLASGGSNIFIRFFTVTFGILAVIGFFQGTSEYLEDYYYKKHCERLRLSKEEKSEQGII